MIRQQLVLDNQLLKPRGHMFPEYIPGAYPVHILRGYVFAQIRVKWHIAGMCLVWVFRMCQQSIYGTLPVCSAIVLSTLSVICFFWIVLGTSQHFKIDTCNWVTVTQMVLSAFFYYNTIELRGLRFPVLDMHPLCVADTYERRWVSNAFFYYNTFVLALTFVAEVRTLRVNVISVCVECMYANDVRKRKIWLMW